MEGLERVEGGSGELDVCRDGEEAERLFFLLSFFFRMTSQTVACRDRP